MNLEKFGKRVLDIVPEGRQALLLSDQSYLERMSLGPVNRNVQPKWVQSLKAEMNTLALAREHTTLVACVYEHELKEEENSADGVAVTATVLDGQHRFLALKEMCSENPHLKYDFWLQLYIIRSEAEMETLIHDLDRRLVISTKDKKTIKDRRSFAEAFLSLIPPAQHTRRCVSGTLKHKVLRSEAVVEALKDMPFEEIVRRIKGAAAPAEDAFKAAGFKKTDAVFKLIKDTKLYMLIDWESGDWIQQAFVPPAPLATHPHSLI